MANSGKEREDLGIETMRRKIRKREREGRVVGKKRRNGGEKGGKARRKEARKEGRKEETN